MAGGLVIGDQLGCETGLATKPPVQRVDVQERHHDREQELPTPVLLTQVRGLVEQHRPETVVMGVVT